LGNNPSFTEQFGNTTSQLLVSKASITYAANSQSGSFDVKDSAGNAVTASPATSWGPKTKSGTQFTTVLTPSSVTSGFKLKSTSGSFSVVKATFDLVSQRDATFCPPGTTGGQSTYTEGTTTVNYLGNADSSNSCFGIQLTSGDRSYQWLKPLTVSPDAQFTFRQDWTIAAPFPSSPDYSLPKAYVNFEILYPGTTATAPPIPSVDHEMAFCPAWMYGSDGSIALVTDAVGLAKLKALDMESDVAGVPGSIGTQFACINKFKRTTEIKTTGLLVKDTIYLIGDANFRF
jgi:hypothetical protein